jgi:uncharacterized protein YkwD
MEDSGPERASPLLVLLVVSSLSGCGDPGGRAAATATPAPSSPSASPSTPIESPTVRSETGCSGSAPAAVDAQAEQEVLELVNAERRKNGFSELRASAGLADAARFHARDLAEEEYLEHDTYDRADGRRVKSCEWSERVRRFVPGTRQLAENIAAGAETPREVVDGWMRSAVHRRNMLGGAYTQVGVGYWPGGSAGFYWVADFGGD